MVASLVLAPAAFGSYSPTLVITRHVNARTGASTVDIGFSQPSDDEATARIQVLSPFMREAVAPGGSVGTFLGSALVGGRMVSLAGTITADDPASPTVETCPGSGRPDAAWRLDLSADGQPLRPLWIGVDAGSSESAATSLELCAPAELKLVDATFRLGAVFRSVPVLSTPFKFDTMWTAIGTPVEGGAVQTQSLDRWLVGTTFSAQRVRRARKVRHKRFTDVYYSYFVHLTGSQSIGCCRAQEAIVVTDRGGVIPALFTDGSFAVLQPLEGTTVYHAEFASDAGLLTDPWTCTFAFPGTRCGTVTFGAVETTSWDVRVVRPKLAHRRMPNARLLP